MLCARTIIEKYLLRVGVAPGMNRLVENERKFAARSRPTKDLTICKNYKYTHTYIYIYMHTYTYAHIHTYIHAYIHICTHTYINTYIHTNIHTYMHT
jgi:hypothetical protein